MSSSSPFLWRVRIVGQTTSSNDDVRRLREQGEGEGIVVQALQQSAGRGRHGRVWASPAGNLYLSFLILPKGGAESVGWYSLLVALAIRDAILDVLPCAAGNIALKWPNDVLVGRKKISGVLLECVDHALICGIGINVTSKPDQPHYPATCLSELGYSGGLDQLRESILSFLSHWIDIYREKGVAPIREAWLSSALRGDMSVKLPSGIMEGVFHGLDDNGCLLLKLADGTCQLVSAGDVFPSGG